MTNRLFLLAALLAPTIALAQPASDAVPPPPPPDAPQPTTVIITPPAPAPTVVEPDPAPTTTTVIMPAPASDYEVIEDTYNAPIFVSGALVFGAAYGASVITAASTDDSRGNQRLYIPLAGPWLALNDRGDCNITLRSCDHETTAKVLLIADGVFQAVGVIGMIDGIFQPSTHRVVRHTARLDTKVRVTPATIHGDPGVAVYGRF